MKVVIQTILNVEGNRGFRNGEFHVRDSEYKKYPDFAVAVVAYKWIQQQKRETGQRETIIEKVTWNEVNDITEIVKEIEPVLPEDNLPF
ncbi:hypothetical protein [Cytobacillus firmus]|uniref:hypothetical protein n=1 Tax=Cytobacillus firmus TaxID=1399 RepID=UPI0018CCC24C|nr:hypothetical protein [Cytobacillus firmus]MBG9548468.1 hypothetical protein [Cytobacillus firmus]MBG9602813.1 hypothetical protein [Cytobacillus firmus]MBG9655014.1 hypothetical protein [Cytobacillus firmus]MED1908606.1 hypothetical protein [Cytobacillus firmus]MED1942998.1 hypothetical protein [Cytobacillus firmus]